MTKISKCPEQSQVNRKYLNAPVKMVSFLSHNSYQFINNTIAKLSRKWHEPKINEIRVSKNFWLNEFESRKNGTVKIDP